MSDNPKLFVMTSPGVANYATTVTVRDLYIHALVTGCGRVADPEEFARSVHDVVDALLTERAKRQP